MLGASFFVVGVLALVAAVFIYSNREDNSYEKVREGVSGLKAEALTKKEFVETMNNLSADILKTIQSECNTATDVKLQPMQLRVEDAFQMAERVRKEYDFMKAQLHSIDKRVLQQTKSVNVKLDLTTPIPVDVMSMPPPLPNLSKKFEKKGKGKEALIKPPTDN